MRTWGKSHRGDIIKSCLTHILLVSRASGLGCSCVSPVPTAQREWMCSGLESERLGIPPWLFVLHIYSSCF